MEKMLTEKECTEEVCRMARRTALLYYYFGSTLIQDLGEEEGKRLIAKAIWAYGEHCGRTIRDAVEEMGLPLTQENFDKIPDLPGYGWENSQVTSPDGEVHAIANYCPLAAIWMQLGPEAQKLGRLYCFVDQAKQHAYNPEEKFVHVKNLLDNDPYCEFKVVPDSELG
jgi:hypothetical protein